MKDVDCKHSPGEVVPVIDRERCESKGPCVEVCPYDVLVLRTVPADDRRLLGLKGRLKLWVHGSRQAYADRADRCHGCGLCITACPEHAITLQKAG